VFRRLLLVAGGGLALSVALVTAQTGTTGASKPASPSRPTSAKAPAGEPGGGTAATPAVKATPQAPAKTEARAAASVPDVNARAVVDKYCITCHNARLKTAGLLLDELDLTHLGDHAEKGEIIVRKLRAGLMPPSPMPRPDDKTMESLIRWLEGELDKSAVTHLPAPGLHRLNRTEYANAIRDLLALQVDTTKFLPSDDSTRGFDNIAGALTMSPALMEAYLSASGKISRLAVGDVTSPRQEVYDVPPDTAQNHHIEGLPFGTRGGMMITHQFPADGAYSFKVKGVTGYFQAVLGQISGEQLEVTIDGERVKVFDWDKEIKNTTGNGRSTPRIPVTAGLHTVGVTFIQTNDLPATELNRPFQRTMNTPGEIPGFLFYPHVGQVIIEGPFDAKGAPDTAARRRIFVCTPKTPREETPCARTILSTVAKRAFRRPVTATDVNKLLGFYNAGREEGGSFDQGIEAALQRILADVEFIYRGEREPSALVAGKPYRLTDLELASRLSFFLWSSIPDDELIDAAAQGRLKDPAVLEKQVKRMLADPRSSALVDNFTGQWLNVRGLKVSEPVVNLFPDFDDNLREAYEREVELFFTSIVQEDRSALDLLTANDTFVNERLAKHYGIPNIYGSHFRRVTLPRELDMRRGLLGKGALMTVTSSAAHTSPVIRGKWFQTTFLGVEPPQPPPGVDTSLKGRVASDNAGNVKVPTMRDVLEQHHASPTCAACHRIFEPIGLALENFDAVGAWRTLDEGQPIDASAVLPDGSKVDGAIGLRDSLVRHSDQFVRVLTEKLLTYAIGRGVEYQDMPMLRSIVRNSATNNYRFSSLVMGIVKSDMFQMNQKTVDRADERAAR
jgi:mono/diheme cytochrome c family protein